jgi:LPS sulfotransferase NodH
MPMVNQPEQSYSLWFTQRVGSTLMAQALEDTGVAGRPREWLNASSAVEVMKKHGAATGRELRDQLWRVATTANGVLGIKYGMVPKLHDDLIELMARVESQKTGRSYDAWQVFFPDCSHCLLTRRDKVRLAISWWRAIKSQEWQICESCVTRLARDRRQGVISALVTLRDLSLPSRLSEQPQCRKALRVRLIAPECISLSRR